MQLERWRAKLEGADDSSSGSLRVTMIFRREDGEWKVAHRHADPIAAPRPVQSIADESRD